MKRSRHHIDFLSWSRNEQELNNHGQNVHLKLIWAAGKLNRDIWFNVDIQEFCKLFTVLFCLNCWFSLSADESVFCLCRTPCAQWPSRRWGRPDWRRSNRSCSIQKNSRWVTVSPPQRREWRRRVCVCVDVLWLDVSSCHSDVFRGQPERSAAAQTRQRPPSCCRQTSPEERARVPR